MEGEGTQGSYSELATELGSNPRLPALRAGLLVLLSGSRWELFFTLSAFGCGSENDLVPLQGPGLRGSCGWGCPGITAKISSSFLRNASVVCAEEGSGGPETGGGRGARGPKLLPASPRPSRAAPTHPDAAASPSQGPGALRPSPHAAPQRLENPSRLLELPTLQPCLAFSLCLECSSPPSPLGSNSNVTSSGKPSPITPPREKHTWAGSGARRPLIMNSIMHCDSWPVSSTSYLESARCST